MGRTRVLLDTIKKISLNSNHKIDFIWTSKSEGHYLCDENEFKDLAKKIGCKFLCEPKINNVKDLSFIKNTEIVISINFINIIPKKFIDLFEYGVLNAHGGDLPRYKGNACQNWAIINNEKEIVLTIHKMTDILDSGPFYLKKSFKLDDDKYITDVYKWFHDSIPGFFLQVIKKIEKGYKPEEQKNIKPLRTFPRKIEDSRIDWKIGVDSICRIIRASSHPFSGAFSFLNNKEKVVIFRAKPITLKYDFFAIDGQIIEWDKNNLSFVVASKNRALVVTEFSSDGLSQAESFHSITSSQRNRMY